MLHKWASLPCLTVCAAHGRRCARTADRRPGVIVQDDPAAQRYPLAVNAAGQYDTFFGRIREDLSHPSALDMWIVADNLLKVAASNAVQIAEIL